MNLGDTVYFVTARPQRCEECHQIGPNLTFAVGSGIVVAKENKLSGVWDSEEPTGDSPCIPPVDYNRKPDRTTVLSTIYVRCEGSNTITGTMAMFRGQLYSTEERAQEALTNQTFIPVLVRDIDPILGIES